MRGDGFWFENSPARKALFICEAKVNYRKYSSYFKFTNIITIIIRKNKN